MSEGMSVRFAKDYVVVVDPDPSAYSASMCFHCGEFFSGTGQSLRAAMAEADQKLDRHDCPAKEQRTGDETV